MEKDVFVNMTPDYEIVDKFGVPLVMKLKKSLCGLRQSPNNWFGTMDHHLTKIVFHPLKWNPCIYASEHEAGFVHSYTVRG